MKSLYIVGAGGFGREVFCWLQHMPEWCMEWKFMGFLDAKGPAALQPYKFPAAVVGDPATFQPESGDQFIMAIADPATRLKIARELRIRGASFPTVKHPTVTIGLECFFGSGCVICPGAVINTNVVMGDFVIVNSQTTIGHDAVVGEGTTLNGHVDITGGVILGEGVFVGSHASILPGAKVGAYARVGAGSVVLRKVGAGTTVMGVPAKQIIP